MLFRKPDQVREPLYAIVPLQNPWRWRSRWKHTERAIKHFIDAGAVVYLVEVAFNRREFAFADSGLDGTLASCEVLGPNHNHRHRYIGLRSTHELWLKENMINVGVSRLPHDWQQVCWLDSDVTFLRPNWVGECIHKLQHYDFLQMFSSARDLGPNYEMLDETYPHASGISFVNAWQQGLLSTDLKRLERITKRVERKVADSPLLAADAKRVDADIKKLARDAADYNYPPRVWPGLAWAARRTAFDQVGGLFDVAIWGGGDYDMAHALIEQAVGRTHHGVHENYKTMLAEYESRCCSHIRRNVGVMEGTVVHYWHGRKTDRKYVEKRKLMNKVAFDPLRHLKRDYQGLYQLHDDGTENYVHFRDMMRKIARERNEDTTEL